MEKQASPLMPAALLAELLVRMDSVSLDLEAMRRERVQTISNWSPDTSTRGSTSACEVVMARPDPVLRWGDEALIQALAYQYAQADQGERIDQRKEGFAKCI